MNSKTIDILETLESLTPERRKAAIWLIKNIKIVDMLTEGEKIPKNELEDIKQSAMKRNDYALAAICDYKRILDEKREIGELLE